MNITKRSTDCKIVEYSSFQFSELLYFDLNANYIMVVTSTYRTQIHRDILNRQSLLQKNAIQSKTTHALQYLKNYRRVKLFFTDLFLILQDLP